MMGKLVLSRRGSDVFKEALLPDFLGDIFCPGGQVRLGQFETGETGLDFGDLVYRKQNVFVHY